MIVLFWITSNNTIRIFDKDIKKPEQSLLLLSIRIYILYISHIMKSTTTSSARLQNDFGADLWVKNPPKHVSLYFPPSFSYNANKKWSIPQQAVASSPAFKTLRTIMSSRAGRSAAMWRVRGFWGVCWVGKSPDFISVVVVMVVNERLWLGSLGDRISLLLIRCIDWRLWGVFDGFMMYLWFLFGVWDSL